MLALKLARVKKGWTQEQLAKKSGLSRSTISNIEKDKQNTKEIQFRILTRLSKALEITVQELLFYDYTRYTGRRLKNNE